MKKTKWSWISVSLILTLLALTACSKSNLLVKILGTWELVNVIDVDDPVIEEWKFDVDDLLYIYKVTPDTTSPDSVRRQLVDQGKYSVKIKMFTRYVVISDMSVNSFNAEWEITQAKKNTLIIVSDKEGGLLIKEFTKKDF